MLTATVVEQRLKNSSLTLQDFLGVGRGSELQRCTAPEHDR